MKQRPIFFNTEQVQAILAGRKTQTRRIAKPQPHSEFTHAEFETNGWAFYETDKDTDDNGRFPDANGFEHVTCPYGQPGDRLWVRERFYKYTGTQPGVNPKFRYFADGEIDQSDLRLWTAWDSKPSIHMPKEAARIFLQIEEIRVERLHDITEADALAEGILQEKHEFVTFPGKPSIWQRKDYLKTAETGVPHYKTITAQASFSTLWQSIHGSESWDANPWVFVITFQKIEKP